jgi:hypothetical protein
MEIEKKIRMHFSDRGWLGCHLGGVLVGGHVCHVDVRAHHDMIAEPVPAPQEIAYARAQG